MTDMIPRITIRDSDDAIVILEALQLHAQTRVTEMTILSRKAGPSTDQFAITAQMIDEMQLIIGLIDAVGSGVIQDQPENLE